MMVLLQRFKEVDIAGGVGANNVFVVDTATLPGGPSSPNDVAGAAHGAGAWV